MGKSGTFVIDDQFAPLTDKILAAIRAITPSPMRFVVNTHWHGDHTGGNENFGKAGALIVAHENVRKRMSAEQFNELFDRKTPPSPKAALPVVTFTDAITFHWNGDEIRVFHVPPAHTDGDSIVQFSKADVVHMGDVFFNGSYPVRRRLERRAGRRRDRGRGPRPRRDGRRHALHPRPRAARDPGRSPGLPRHAEGPCATGSPRSKPRGRAARR